MYQTQINYVIIVTLVIYYLFIYLYQATRPINIINTNGKKRTDTQICKQTDIKAVQKETWKQ